MSGSHYAISDVPNRYKYNGKEEFSDLQWLNYGARFYDAAVGRWWSRDPKAEKAQAWSVYRYGFDNPVSVTDPDGRLEDWWRRKEHGKWVYYDIKGSTIRNRGQGFFKFFQYCGPDKSIQTVGGEEVLLPAFIPLAGTNYLPVTRTFLQ